MGRCGHAGCGAADLGDGRCLSHATDTQLKRAITRWREGATFDARRTVVDSAQLDLFLFLLSLGDQTMRVWPLKSDHRPAFCGPANFEGAHFVDDVDLGGICFEGPALFDGAVFAGDARFSEAEFKAHADFDDVTFEGAASFRRAVFREHLGLGGAAVAGRAIFAGAVFEDYVDLEGARLADDLDLQEASFPVARILGPWDVAGDLVLEHCVFGERVRLETRAHRISASSAIFAGGGRLALATEELEMDGVDFARATTLSGVQPKAAQSAWVARAPATEMPKLLTLRGALVSSLALSRIDLSECHFFGAHGLESMVVEPDCRWRHTPPRRRCIDREMIIEEQRWREGSDARRRRNPVRCRPLWTYGGSGASAASGRPELDPHQLAAIYRALRRSREDNRDQAGSGDLYYGEMEMRRLTALPSGRGRVRALCDRAIITAYWLLSGYGLKASRALLAWLLLTCAATFALWRWGISPAPSLSRAGLVATEGSSSLIRPAHLPPPYALTETGEAIGLSLRVLGPILVGLFLLALRARVKR